MFNPVIVLSVLIGLIIGVGLWAVIVFGILLHEVLWPTEDDD